MILRFETRAPIPLWRPLLILALATCYGLVLLLAGGAGRVAGAGDHWLLSVSPQPATTEASDSGPAVTSSTPRLETAPPSLAPTTVPELLTPAPSATPRPSPSMSLTAPQEAAHPEPARDPPAPPVAATLAAPPGPPSLFNGSGHRADRATWPKGAGNGRKGGGKP